MRFSTGGKFEAGARKKERSVGSCLKASSGKKPIRNYLKKIYHKKAGPVVQGVGSDQTPEWPKNNEKFCSVSVWAPKEFNRTHEQMPDIYNLIGNQNLKRQCIPPHICWNC
jgi:hypothetical protein